jgi:hypothetical protein
MTTIPIIMAQIVPFPVNIHVQESVRRPTKEARMVQFCIERMPWGVSSQSSGCLYHSSKVKCHGNGKKWTSVSILEPIWSAVGLEIFFRHSHVTCHSSRRKFRRLEPSVGYGFPIRGDRREFVHRLRRQKPHHVTCAATRRMWLLASNFSIENFPFDTVLFIPVVVFIFITAIWM